jgi:hypothetical protein
VNADELAQLPLQELRARRAALQADDDAVSYVRRLVQARIDLVATEVDRRAGVHHEITRELPVILGSHLTGGPARPPRPAEDASDHPLALELEELSARLGVDDLPALDDEQLRSAERRALFARIDELSAELVRRYREGEADIDGLLAAD